ncbi:hypothetical protein [Hydrocarboniphaga sp.]|uniref:hypothetical protein n=1 Tax=Hydrocarboniphaga sp. TaxID=2033016 RepID=UPI003D0CD8E4
MIGLYSSHATTYLLILMVSTTLAFALPIFLKPLVWARLMQWKIPQDTDLAVYFGRCLGAFILIIELVALRAALTGADLRLAFDLMFCVYGFMTVVHVYGALRRIQPITETLEIGFWILLAVLNLLFYPAA